MRIQWELITAGIVGFTVVAMLQAWWIGRSIERIITHETWAKTVDDWSKLTRQDMAGVLLLLGITNGLLAAIAAILLFR